MIISFVLLESDKELYAQAKAIKDPKRKGYKIDCVGNRELYRMGMEAWINSQTGG